MSDVTQPTILVIVGISGDLSKRYLLPAIKQISKAGALPEAFRIVGVSRRDLTLDDVVAGDREFWEKHIELHQMDLDNAADYHTLAAQLEGVERSLGGQAQRLFYLSVPPEAVANVVTKLGESGLSKAQNTKLLLEKPFGTNLASAQTLVDHIMKYFNEDQVYRIDHYLAKEMVQSIVVFRNSNPLFAHTWNKDFIAHIEVTMAEEIGIENRVDHYEQTGALRDVVQSHLLQLAALTLMSLPDEGASRGIQAHRLKALKAIKPIDTSKAVRGQYQGYKEEVNNPNSTVETFTSLVLESSDPLWEGVPVTVSAGKALNRRYTEIRLTYHAKNLEQPNYLALRIQPNEGVEVCVWLKKPGFGMEKEMRSLDFGYKQDEANMLPDAYERVFVDAIRSDHSLFTTSDEVLASWKILEPLQEAWQTGGTDLQVYKKGSAVADIVQ